MVSLNSRHFSLFWTSKWSYCVSLWGMRCAVQWALSMTWVAGLPKLGRRGRERREVLPIPLPSPEKHSHPKKPATQVMDSISMGIILLLSIAFLIDFSVWAMESIIFFRFQFYNCLEIPDGLLDWLLFGRWSTYTPHITHTLYISHQSFWILLFEFLTRNRLVRARNVGKSEPLVNK